MTHPCVYSPLPSRAGAPCCYCFYSYRFGLYTISPQYQHCRYDGLDWNAHNVPGQENRYDCEHVALHACLRSVGGRIAVAPYSVTRDAMVATLFPH